MESIPIYNQMYVPSGKMPGMFLWKNKMQKYSYCPLFHVVLAIFVIKYNLKKVNNKYWKERYKILFACMIILKKHKST